MPDLIGYLVQKHSETARDTIIFQGIASSFYSFLHMVSPKGAQIANEITTPEYQKVCISVVYA